MAERNMCSVGTRDTVVPPGSASGVDRLTWQDYEADLERKLGDLHDRVHRGAYRALPSRRVYILSRMDGNDRSRSLPWKTRLSNGR